MKTFIQNNKATLIACGIGLAGITVGATLGQLGKTTPETAVKLGPPVPSTNVRTETDPMTDSKRHLLLIESTDTSPNSIGSPETSTLVFRCDAGKKPDAYVVIAGYIGIFDSPVVQTRWDGGKVNSEAWTTSQDGSAIFSGAPKSTLQKAASQDSLVVSWQPFGKTRQAASFDLKQHRGDLSAMEQLCS